MIIVPKYAEGRLDRLPALAQELVQMKVDVIVAMGGPPLRPAAEATRSIPIVMVNGSADPIADGFATSLARPGGNITGVTWAPSPELVGKILELLREAIPGISRVALLSDGTVRAKGWSTWTDAAQKLGIQVEKFEVHDRSAIEPAIAEMRRRRVQAVHVTMGAATYSYRNQVAALALAARLPTVATARELPEAGGLFSYGPNTAVAFRRGAAYVDKILRGAKAGDLPIEQPTNFDLVINVKTAKVLGVQVPASMLMQAAEVIE
jgi:putative ABC transport system substrate-binding protein